ncbi:YbgF trimerization domain-containing protein [Aestuariispira insulae]|nr:YbgF trimerization domain-containing protein [Aestuariispira insulae]
MRFSFPFSSGNHRSLVAVPAALILAGLLVIGLEQPAQAQSSVNQLQQQVNSLRQEIADLQKVVYKGAPPPANAAEGLVDDRQVTAQLQAQIQLLEEQRRDLNGKIEDLDIKMRRIETRLDKLVSDVDFRLRALEQGGTGQMSSSMGQGSSFQSSQQSASAQATDSGTTIITSRGAQGPGGTTGNLAAGQQGFGQITSEDLAALERGDLKPSGEQPVVRQPQQPQVPAPAPSAASTPGAVASLAPPAQQSGGAVLQGGTPKEQYDYAYSFLPKHDFASAEIAFRAFLDQNGEHELASNAMYWLGETYYARQQFEDAAAVFSDAYLRDRKASKATHSLLKFAMSLEQVGQKDSSCVAYQELLLKHEDAEPRILERARAARKNLGCQ